MEKGPENNPERNPMRKYRERPGGKLQRKDEKGPEKKYKNVQERKPRGPERERSRERPIVRKQRKAQ